MFEIVEDSGFFSHPLIDFDVSLVLVQPCT
jgi:hypothetical protein